MLRELCAFTSPCRPQVLAAVRQICSVGKTLEEALGRPSVLQRAEEMLPGACSSLMLTVVEAHLVPFGAQPGAGQQPFLASNCAVLSGSGPLLGPLSEPIWQVVFLMLPAAAACTAALPDSSPHALNKKCLLAALLKAAAGSESGRLSNMAMDYAILGISDTRLKPVLGSLLQLALDLEQLFQHHDLLQQGQPDPATALANCLAVFSSTPMALLCLVAAGSITLGNQPVYDECTIRQLRQLQQLHCRTVQRVAETPLSAGSPWPMVCAASGRAVLAVSHLLDRMSIEASRRKQHELPLVRQYVDTLRQQCSTGTDLTTAQRMGLADGLLAISASVLGPVPFMHEMDLIASQPNADDELSKLLSFSHPSLLALAFLQQEVLWFFAAKDNMEVLSELLPAAFLAQRNRLVGGYLSTSIDDKPKPTRRRLLAMITQQCSIRTTSAMHFAVKFGHVGSPVPVKPDMLALLAATAAWPLEVLLVGVPEVKKDLMQHSWIAAKTIMEKLSCVLAIRDTDGRTPWRCSPDALAGCAVALLAFAQYAGMIGSIPSHPGIFLSTPTQTAQQAAAWLRANPTAVMKLGPHPTMFLRQLRWCGCWAGWLSPPARWQRPRLCWRRRCPPWSTGCAPGRPCGSCWRRRAAGGSGRPWRRRCTGGYFGAWRLVSRRRWTA